MELRFPVATQAERGTPRHDVYPSTRPQTGMRRQRKLKSIKEVVSRSLGGTMHTGTLIGTPHAIQSYAVLY